METSKFCEICAAIINTCEKKGKVHDMQDIKPNCYVEEKTKYKIVTLCGSTKFKKEFMEQQKRLTLEGCIVISAGLFGHSGDHEVWEGMDEDTLTNTKIMLDDMHKRKIDMADEIFVINVNGYIGESTKSEIKYALSQNKIVRYLEEKPFKLSLPFLPGTWVKTNDGYFGTVSGYTVSDNNDYTINFSAYMDSFGGEYLLEEIKLMSKEEIDLVVSSYEARKITNYEV